MRILLSGHTKIFIEAERKFQQFLGWFLQPRRTMGSLVENSVWAVDNDCYSQGDNFDFNTWLIYLNRIKDWPGDNKFVTVPDVVGNADATHKRWLEFAPEMKKFDMPMAYVAQDGLKDLPDIDFDALFIGGTTKFKMGQDVARLIKLAKANEKWVHVGRVNSLTRIKHFYLLGADSIDGSAWIRNPSSLTKRYLPYLQSLFYQGRLL